MVRGSCGWYNQSASKILIVEVCSQRGAFRAEELTSVGAVYDKFKSFIAAAIPPAPQTEETNQWVFLNT